MSSAGLKFEKVTQTKVAYVQLIGPYEDWGKGLMELKEWLKGQQAQIVGKPIGLFYDNPTETPPTKLRSDACLPIQRDLIPTGKF
jgi:DNA gyrase inhibitor GyrI